MNKIVLALSFIVLILFSIIVAGSLLLNLEADEAEVKLYTFPISVGDKTCTVGVRSNYSVSDVRYFGILRYVSVDFRGSLRATVFCEIIVPGDLIWGELFVYKKGYIQSEDSYVLSNNGTHYSVQMTFKHIATVEVISIRGTEGVVEFPTPTPTPDQNEKPIYDVRIIEFKWTSDWVKGPVPGDWRFRNFITTIQNFVDIDVYGLTVEARIIANNSELVTATAILYGTLEGVLYGGESRELVGRVNIVLDELEQASGEWSNKIFVMLDDLVLYELAIP